MGLPPVLPRSLHGGPSATPFHGLDFSVNSNPHGPNPTLLSAVRAADHAHYPDPTYHAVRERLAAWHGAQPDGVTLATGASELLHRLARAFLPAGGTLLSLHAPFGELARAAALCRAQVQVVTRLPRQITGAQLVYVGQPHNPTGLHLTPPELLSVAQACAAAGALLVLDEAYAPFLSLPLRLELPAAVRVHSPGKAHGLVGARPAYALGAADVIARLENLAPAWHVTAGTAALLGALPEAQGFLGRTVAAIQADAAALAGALGAFGAVTHHGTPYLMLEVGDAAAVTRRLLARGVKVRDCGSYGWPQHVRICTRTPQDNRVLLEALGATLAAPLSRRPRRVP